MSNVLVVGVYYTERPSLVVPLVTTLNASAQHVVTQRWIALGNGPMQPFLQSYVRRFYGWKFPLLNDLLAEQDDLQAYDYLIVVDDDITVEPMFIDHYLQAVDAFDLALAQPARTTKSAIHHEIVKQRPGIARRTRFVEIGPLVSMRRDLFPHLLPFDETSPMGWGYDFVWPVIVERLGLYMGIVDATPVEHTFRPAHGYSFDEAGQAMRKLLDRYPHLTPEEAYREQ